MYHISNDKRAKKSAERIGKGLLFCLRTKSFSQITVTDVQKNSSVGRASFYRLFDNTADVLSYLCDGVFEKAGRDFSTIKPQNPKRTTLKFIECWMNDKTLLNAIIDCNRIDFLYNAHYKYVAKDINLFFPDEKLDEVKTNYLITTMTACTAAFLTAWLKNGGKETAEQLQYNLKNCFAALNKIFD